MAEVSGILTEVLVSALEKKKHDDEACGEIETAPPCYPGSERNSQVVSLTRPLFAGGPEVRALCCGKEQMWKQIFIPLVGSGLQSYQ